MIQWDRKKFRKNLSKQIISLLGLMLFFSLAYQFQQTYAGKTAPFEIEHRSIVPLKEISGLTVHANTQGKQVSFITDRKAEILHYVQPQGQSIKKKFQSAVLDTEAPCQDSEFQDCKEVNQKLLANWEGLTRDGKQRFFALQEHTQRLYILTPGLEKIEKILEFDLAASFEPNWRFKSNRLNRNSLAEGLILLKNGHFLIAKEKDPMLFVEFGPKGSVAQGLHAGTILGPKESFSLPETTDLRVPYEALATWPLAAHGKCDISDLAVDAEGQLLALSESCLQVAVYPRLDVGFKAEVKEYLPLPEEIKRPEALAVEGPLWYVASDLASKNQYNFYILRRSNPVE